MKTAIWWVRRDLRLADNQALYAALNAAEEIIPCFVFDPILEQSQYNGEKRQAFMLGGLRVLDERLRELGSRLVIRRGAPAEQLKKLVEETGAAAVYAEEDYSPYARQRDAGIGSLLPLHLQPGVTVYPPDAVKKGDGDPFVVFTPFSRRWRQLNPPAKTDLHPAPLHIKTRERLESLPVPDSPALPAVFLFPPGEAEAERRLSAFTLANGARVYRYKDDRNSPALDGTSGLSPYLRFGMISARRVAIAAIHAQAAAPDDPAQDSAITWLSELIWREFYTSVLYHFPRVRSESFRAQYRHIRWRNNRSEFEAWCEGRTGYPFVDAAMRHLRHTGWMHNRARMVVASFLVKDLLIDWRWGEQFFMQHLIDGDPAANNGGWQWAAGTGTDAAPYFRVFNPSSQGKHHDPEGQFVRRWLPELARVPDNTVHEPWKMREAEQREAGCIIGKDYPAPIVDHALARERCLQAFRAARER